MNMQQEYSVTAGYEAVIVGAGPVGLLLANLLARQGIRTALVEQRTELPPYSMAIGITPPSLDIFSQIGLAEQFVEHGVPVRDVSVYDASRCLGHLSFAGIDSLWPFILSIPQNTTMNLLQDALGSYQCLTRYNGFRFERFRQDKSGVVSGIVCVETGTKLQLDSSFLVGCDGAHSRVRACLQMPRRERRYPHAFVMGEFADRSDFGHKACLFFTENGSLESFPLPEQRRRWITMLPRMHSPSTEKQQVAWLIQSVRELSGFVLARGDCTWISTFQPERALCRAYHDARVVLCGDAAHVMSPIGGQGMNTGFADAQRLADTLRCILHEVTPFSPALNDYTNARMRDFRVAATRAAAGMWVGTRKGLTARLRSFLFRHLLKMDGVQSILANSFSMLNLPGRITGFKPFRLTRERISLASAFESAETRREVNLRIFSIVAPRYALVAKLLSFGRDNAWKRRLINELPALEQPTCVDLACGNGDLTRRLLCRYANASITGIDQSAEMLAEARRTIRDERVCFLQTDMLNTGLYDVSCDLITAGYALRNAPDLRQAVAEIARILKPGGRVAIIDFSRSPHRSIALAQYLLLWLWGGWWGLILHGNPRIYGYIAASLMQFPDRNTLRRVLSDYGLRVVSARLGFGGMIETLQLEKTEAAS